ncbi:MAG: ribosome small subunit-dependent GTPase A [Clostridia bacterium]|nr:ribosome small subunit-dependent GTPase A [Clostridia bacterium]
MKGIIIKGIGGFYYVKTANNSVYECKARGIFRKDKITPTVGDRVEITIKDNKGSIDTIYERKSLLIRPPVANIDTIIIVVAAAEPEPNTKIIDKMILNAKVAGIEPIICINKTDIKDGDTLEAVYHNAGYRVIKVSAKESKGIDELNSVLKDRISAFAGISGVGKSSLLNELTDVGAQTGEISDKIQRGKHTTRHVELFELPYGGYVLDTPGFSTFEPTDIKADELWHYFPEMEAVGDNCRFRGCLHINEPDCAVKEKLDMGNIAHSRYESYVEIYNILKEKKDWEKK